ncbi:acetyltransferase [Arthrobacter sp. ERGS1:01]|uniref:GNAT family N-acetyltransferase n=1 Tax=Arthrobacter sp. ERGS1:01 TaxID=1704044 RepID=UPI0006B62A0F|nr:GNAT family N-acetyltransferase [Arthrobacter sp. ERGS1:01]ALE05424.1 acetyltransferase [Arthrobacter sp. ERGS1:01]
MTFTFRPVDAVADAPLLHSWVTRDYARFWGMQSASVVDVAAEYQGIQASGHHTALLGLDDGIPVFLMERYDPSRSPLYGLYAAKPGDVGMHLLVSPPDHPRPGFTTAVMTAVLGHLFEDPAVDRVVVEPDAANHKIQALNARLGFRHQALIRLPDKEARLSVCTRRTFNDARRHLITSSPRKEQTP